MALPDLTTQREDERLAPLLHSRASALDVRTITEAALLLDATVLLVLVRTFLPIPGFQGLVRLACPLPFIVLTLRRGVRAGLVATVAAFVLLSTFVGPLLASQALVYGGLGTLFAWASTRKWSIAPTVVVGATAYGVLYLLPPFILGLAALRIDLPKTLHDVQKQSHQFLDGLSHVRLLGINITHPFLSFFSSFALGRTLLDLLHGLADAALTHPLTTLILFFAVFSVINVWSYLVISVELYRRLPAETRHDTRGGRIDFFPFG